MKKTQVIRGGMALAAALLLANVSLAARPALIQPVDPVVAQPGYDPDEWALVANHTHSSTGIGKYRPEGLEKIVEKASDLGFDMVIVTDHNTVEHWYDPAFSASSDVVLVQGTEWTSEDGHANIVGFATEDAADVIVPCDWEHAPEPCSGGIDYQPMIDEVHERGGLVIVNHPRLRRHFWPEDAMGADAVEVNRNLTDVFGRGGRAWWHRRLAEGHRMAAMGGSDWHYWSPFGDNDPETHTCTTEHLVQSAWPYPGFDDASNLVRVAGRSQDALMDAIRKRHVLVRQHLDGPLLFLGADLDGDGSFEDARAGDDVTDATETGAMVRLQARVLDGDGEELRVILSWKRPGGARVEAVREIEVDGDDFPYAFEVPRGEPGASFVRLEIGTRGQAVGNPIFF